MRKILFLDDDPVAQRLVKHALGSEFEVISCYTIADAKKLLETCTDISAAVIDRSLPDGDGMAICSQLRQSDQSQTMPILFLSNAGTETDKVTAFFAGADDYITKPFGLLELKARILARLRRTSQKIFAAQLEVDLDSHRVHFRDNDQVKEIPLTRTEYRILVVLMQSLDRVANREVLLDKVWGSETNVTDRVVDSHVSHLRKKISHTGVILESLRGEGYRLSLAKQQPKSA